MRDPDPAQKFRFDFLPCPLGGGIYLLPCPGRRGRDDRGRDWQRNLSDDLDMLEQHRIRGVVTLLPLDEMRRYDIAALPQEVVQRGWHWWHWPVADMAVADHSVFEAINAALPALRAIWQQGDAVAVHCAAGLGRTGTLAAQLLVLQGVAPDEAILRVRQARPGTIETPAQEQAVSDQLLRG